MISILWRISSSDRWLHIKGGQKSLRKSKLIRVAEICESIKLVGNYRLSSSSLSLSEKHQTSHRHSGFGFLFLAHSSIDWRVSHHGVGNNALGKFELESHLFGSFWINSLVKDMNLLILRRSYSLNSNTNCSLITTALEYHSQIRLCDTYIECSEHIYIERRNLETRKTLTTS